MAPTIDRVSQARGVSKMKRLLAILFVAFLFITNHGCNNGSDPVGDTPPPEQTSGEVEGEGSGDETPEMPEVGPSGGTMDPNPTPTSSEEAGAGKPESTDSNESPTE